MIASFTASLAGVLTFLFIFWKRLKEDYSSEIIFKTAGNILAGIAIGWAISYKFFPQGFLWFELVVGIAGLGFSVASLKVRFYETFEAYIIAALPWLAFLFLKDSVVSSSLISFSAFLAVLIFIFIFYYFDLHYKNFSWYGSGKIGFSGLAILVIIFALRSGLAMGRIAVISFLSGYEVYISGVGMVAALLLLINLGRQKK